MTGPDERPMMERQRDELAARVEALEAINAQLVTALQPFVDKADLSVQTKWLRDAEDALRAAGEGDGR